MKECYFQYNCNFTKSNIPPWVFLRFLNCTYGRKSRKASRINTPFSIYLKSILDDARFPSVSVAFQKTLDFGKCSLLINIAIVVKMQLKLILR